MHIPVLLKETIDSLSLEKGDIYLDATLGGGGHAEEAWKRMGNSVEILGIDLDETALEIARNRLEMAGCKPHLALQSFRNIDKAVETIGMGNPSKIVFDLGWNSMQVEEGERGFSFQKDEPLLMTFSKDENPEVTTAHDIVNFWQEENIADIIYAYGEENFSRRIARKIVEEREKGEIKSSLQLAEIIKGAVPIFYRFGRIHPATKTFQALRIAVNDELQALKEGLEKAFMVLKKGGRIAVISFHSLEDRIVKNFFKELEEKGEAEYPLATGKKPITATEEEIEKNRKSRSAKLRVIKKN